MKKLLLIMMASAICFFTTGVQSIAKAKMMTPYYYDSNFSSDSSLVAQKFRYADAILIKNIDDYIQLLNIQEVPTSSNSEAHKIFDEICNYCTDNNSSITFTNKASSSLVQILFYQDKYDGQLSRQISLFTASQKQQYLVIQYNILMSARLYNSASSELENLISDNPYDYKLAKMTSVIGGLHFNERVSDEISSNMALSGKSYISDVINPPTNANAPKNSNNLYNYNDPQIAITLDVVNAREQDARMQYSNILASANSKSSNDDLFFEYETKGLEYLEVKKNYVKALEYFTKAINLKPSKGEAWQCRGDVKCCLGDFNGAIYDYNKAISLGYKVAWNYYSRAFLKIRLGQYKGAQEDFKKAYALTYGTKQEGIATMSKVYVEQLQEGKGPFLRQFLSDPYSVFKEPIEQMISKSMRIDSDSKPTTPYQVPTKPQQKSVCPVGSRVYLIFARFKDTHAMVKYTTIAKTTDIENMVNSDSRFEWIRYESVPDQEYNNYPHY